MRNLFPALVAALAAVVALPSFAASQARPLEWKVGNQAFSGYLVYDDSKADLRPGLVMVPNWMGVNESAVEKARRIAGDDYVVLVADVYGRGVRPKDAKEAGAIAGGLRGEDRTQLRERIQGAVDALKTQAGKVPLQANRIGALGFCFGGSAVLELARSGVEGVAGVVSLHGGLEPGAKSATAVAVKTPVLVLNGADDRGISAEDIAAFGKEMDTAGADWQFVNFSGAVHCFAEADANSPPGCLYNERAAKRAYRMMGDFFEEVFKD